MKVASRFTTPAWLWVGGSLCLLALGVGALLHLSLDALQRHLIAGYFWLWPFSWWTTEGGLFWPELSLRIAPWLAAAVALLEIALFLRKRVRVGTRR